MLFFTRKNKVHLSNFCDRFYDENYLGSFPVYQSLFDTYLKKEILFLEGFFYKEILNDLKALQFELFSQAFSHRYSFADVVEQTLFTQNYLHLKKESNVLNHSEYFNVVIGGLNEPVERGGLLSNKEYNQLQKDKAGLMKRFIDKGYDERQIFCAINRVSTFKHWQKLSVADSLAERICNQLEYTPTDEEVTRLKACIVGIYFHADNAMKDIKIINK